MEEGARAVVASVGATADVPASDGITAIFLCGRTFSEHRGNASHGNSTRIVFSSVVRSLQPVRRVENSVRSCTTTRWVYREGGDGVRHHGSEIKLYVCGHRRFQALFMCCDWIQHSSE